MVDNIDQWSIISTLWPACINIVATCKGDQILNEMGSQITCIYTSSQIRTGPPPKKCQILLTGADRDFRGVFFMRKQLLRTFFRGGGAVKKPPCTYIFEGALQWCPSRMPLKDTPRRCPSKMLLKDAPQGCPSRLPLKDAPQIWRRHRRSQCPAWVVGSLSFFHLNYEKTERRRQVLSPLMCGIYPSKMPLKDAPPLARAALKRRFYE